jgi:hypothetical protein
MNERQSARLPEHFGSSFAALFPACGVLLGSYHRPDG